MEVILKHMLLALVVHASITVFSKYNSIFSHVINNELIVMQHCLAMRKLSLNWKLQSTWFHYVDQRDVDTERSITVRIDWSIIVRVSGIVEIILTKLGTFSNTTLPDLQLVRNKPTRIGEQIPLIWKVCTTIWRIWSFWGKWITWCTNGVCCSHE